MVRQTVAIAIALTPAVTLRIGERGRFEVER
jgi:hypothetical protein